MLDIILVFLGAGFGGVIRYVLGAFIYSYTGRAFPYGTLVINLSGSFLMGLLYYVIINYSKNLLPEFSALILVGVLGGYTTFSSFSIETLNLLQAGKIGYAITNVLVSVVLGVVLAFLGILCAKRLLG